MENDGILLHLVEKEDGDEENEMMMNQKDDVTEAIDIVVGSTELENKVAVAHMVGVSSGTEHCPQGSAGPKFLGILEDMAEGSLQNSSDVVHHELAVDKSPKYVADAESGEMSVHSSATLPMMTLHKAVVMGIGVHVMAEVPSIRPWLGKISTLELRKHYLFDHDIEQPILEQPV